MRAEDRVRVRVVSGGIVLSRVGDHRVLCPLQGDQEEHFGLNSSGMSRPLSTQGA